MTFVVVITGKRFFLSPNLIQPSTLINGFYLILVPNFFSLKVAGNILNKSSPLGAGPPRPREPTVKVRLPDTSCAPVLIHLWLRAVFLFLATRAGHKFRQVVFNTVPAWRIFEWPRSCECLWLLLHLPIKFKHCFHDCFVKAAEAGPQFTPFI